MDNNIDLDSLPLELYYFRCECQFWLPTSQKNMRFAGFSGELNFYIDGNLIDYGDEDDIFLKYDLDELINAGIVSIEKLFKSIDISLEENPDMNDEKWKKESYLINLELKHVDNSSFNQSIYQAWFTKKEDYLKAINAIIDREIITNTDN